MIDMNDVGDQLNELGYIYEQHGRGCIAPIYAYKTVTKDIKACIIILWNKVNLKITLQDYWIEAYKRYKKIEDVMELNDAVTNLLNDVTIVEKLLEEQ